MLVPKRVLSEEDIEMLSDLLLQVHKGMVVTVRYFREEDMGMGASGEMPVGTYEEVTGTVTCVEPTGRWLRVFDGEDEVRIGFDDLDMVMGDGIVGVAEFLGIEG